MSDSAIRQLDLPNILTLIGLSISFFSVVCSLEGQFFESIICLICAGVIDLLDGAIARRMQRTPLCSQVGKHLDSIADVCSFGFSPVVFAYCWGLSDGVSLAILTLYLAAGALRLSYFSSVGLQVEAGKQYYMGLPITSVAVLLPVCFLTSFFLSNAWTKPVLLCLFLILAVLMNSTLKIVKPQGTWYGAAVLGALLLIGVYAYAIVQG